MVQMINGSPVYTVRIKFKKIGSLQYISHLDLVRTMSKIVIRAKLPLWYTEGFNPKPKMVFAAPLSIGTESLSEYMDLRITERLPEEEVMARFNANMTEEMSVIEAYYPDCPLTDLKWLEYEVFVKTEGADEFLAEKCNELLSSERIEVLKKTKKGEAVTNIRHLIKSASTEFSNGNLHISMILSSSSEEYLNPEYVITALKEGCGILSSRNLLCEYYQILRTRAYKSDMKDFK